MQHLIYESLDVYSQLRDELQRVIEISREKDPKYASHSGMVLHYYSERCQSLNLLLQEWRLWDSDIIMRSALECATRFLFVSIAPVEERGQRIDEYTVLLNEIEDLQRSERAKPFATRSTNEDTKMLIGGVVLSPEREAEFREKWPKSKRNALKQKWSFTEMAKVLCEFHGEGLDLRGYKSFLHGYGVSSHFIHADQTAMDLVWDRARRSPQERELLENAHFARLATEPTSLLFICWRAMVYATGVDSSNRDVVKNLVALNERADIYHKEFAASQEHLYGRSSSAAP
ncbi:DUF5677 domain-containing protein [Stutzerimonas frequens]|uniref:DUF5677 domain-containing protein n=1 Tax=Stutzerimonas frequens TaxID=2968969 RepID=UPI0029349472|nr:DUF5677 domain-containing protein [Stutzerimonas frequens]WOC79104.1 DUF5677 domain-containing protein [Stutzerimonas frequens]WRW26375.1 DUF5677 domain-containing protein [Stutzerimonas frequens]